MKKFLLIAMTAAAAVASGAEATAAESENSGNSGKSVQSGAAEAKASESEKAELKERKAPLFWGFGNYGIYSGYQLYGALLNSEPTLQGYLEGNANLIFGDYDFGYLGLGVWSNTDLTDKRRDLYGKAFNEWDFNVHWGRTFWFDEDRTWGLDYRASVVWYYYTHGRGHDHNTHGKSHFQYGHDTMTTMDFNHSLSLINPYVIPFVDLVHEYHENNSDLIQFGLKRAVSPCEKLTLTPSVTFVYRDHRYNWCFPTAGWTETHNGGIATMKWQLDANYQICEHFGLFAKVAYCSIIDRDLRDAADNGSGGDYGQYKDYAWGGAGITVNF